MPACLQEVSAESPLTRQLFATAAEPKPLLEFTELQHVKELYIFIYSSYTSMTAETTL